MVRNTLVAMVRKTGLLWFLSAAVFSIVAPSTLQARQSGQIDYESPIIEHANVDAGIIGGVEVFGATVVDNEEVAAVSLFYRFSGESEFAELPMREIASSAYYTVKVDTANVPVSTPAIEYYLQAEDTSGNIVLKGFAFQPLIRAFDVPPPEPAILPEPIPDPEPVVAASRGINWLYVGLGVLAVGSLAAALGGDDGGGAEAPIVEQECPGGCPVTLTFVRPQ